MDYRNLLVNAMIATAFVSFASVGRADMVAADNGIAVEKSEVSTPARGMTMTQVASKFGSPTNKVAAVGKPPISRWEYPGFVVYFEHDHVIHSVVSGAMPSAPDAPPAVEAGPAVDAAPAPAAAPADDAPPTN